MRFLIVGFIILLLSAFLGLQLKHDPGYLLIAINQWTIETTLWFALLCVILSFVFFHGLLVFLNYLRLMPKHYRQWRKHRKIQRAQAMTRKGLIEFSEGYWSSAQKHLIQALPFADTPLINYLTAARAAQELGENQRRDDFLREALQSMPDTKIAVELTQAQLQLAHQQWEQALATLKHLQAIAPKHPHVLKLLMLLYEEVKDWPQLIKLLPYLKKEKTIPDALYENLRLKAYLNALYDSIKTNQTDKISIYFTQLPKDLKSNPLLLAPYIDFLIRSDKKTLAETYLRQALKKEFNENLVTLYKRLDINTEQLGFIEGFLKKQAHSAVLNLTLGQICLEQQLWGKALTYLEKSIENQPSRAAYQALGHYWTYFNNPEKACMAYKNALDYH